MAAYLGDELIVDAWCGPAATGGDEMVDGDTLFTVFSVTKALTLTAVHVQVERGLLDYDAPVSSYWPEFGRRPARSGPPCATRSRIGSASRRCPSASRPSEPPTGTGWSSRSPRSRRSILRASATAITRPPTGGSSASWSGARIPAAARSPGSSTTRSTRRWASRTSGSVCPTIASRVSRASVDAEPSVTDTSGRSAIYEAARHRRRSISCPTSTTARSCARPLCLPASGGIANARSVAQLFAMLANAAVRGNGARLLPGSRVEGFLVPRLAAGRRHRPPDGHRASRKRRGPLLPRRGSHGRAGASADQRRRRRGQRRPGPTSTPSWRWPCVVQPDVRP